MSAEDPRMSAEQPAPQAPPASAPPASPPPPPPAAQAPAAAVSSSGSRVFVIVTAVVIALALGGYLLARSGLLGASQIEDAFMVAPYAPQPPSMASALTPADHTAMGPPSQLTLHVR